MSNVFKVEVTEYSDVKNNKIYDQYIRFISDKKTIKKIYKLIGVKYEQ